MFNFMHRIAGGRLLAAIAALAITLGGIYAFRALPVDAFPDVTPSLVQVFTETEGLAPEEVERYVTYPIESAMAGLPNLKNMRSVSNFGLSVVNIYFEDGTDVYFARQVVGERLSQARGNIPDGFGDPKMGPISTGLGIILYFRLDDATGTRSLVDMREIQDWIIKYQLQTVPGVTEVLSLGGYEKQYQVQLDPDALQAYNLQIGDVMTALERGNKTEGAQFLEIGAEQYTVRGVGLARSIEDLSDIVIKAQDGRPVRISDLGEIIIGGGVRQGLATANGEGEVVSGMVIKLFGTNSSTVIERVEERIATINASLPPGVRIVPYYEQKTLVSALNLQHRTSWLSQRAILRYETVFVLEFLEMALIKWLFQAARKVRAVVIPLVIDLTFMANQQVLFGHMLAMLAAREQAQKMACNLHFLTVLSVPRLVLT